MWLKILLVIGVCCLLYPITLGFIAVVAANLFVSPFSALILAILAGLSAYSEIFCRICDLLGLVFDAFVFTFVGCFLIGGNYGKGLTLIGGLAICFFNLYVFNVFVIMPSLGTLGFSGIKELLIEMGWISTINDAVNSTASFVGANVKNVVTDTVSKEKPFPWIYCILGCITYCYIWYNMGDN